MQVGTYPTGNFATLEPFRSTAAVCWRLNPMQKHFPFTFQHRADVRPFTSFKYLASPVFLLNSRYPLFNATVQKLIYRYPLSRSYRVNLPKFLQCCSLKRLSIFNQSTCVGFSTVQNFSKKKHRLTFTQFTH